MYDKKLLNIVSKGWVPILSPVFYKYTATTKRLKTNYRKEDNHTSFMYRPIGGQVPNGAFLFPRLDDILRPFRVIDPSKIKVVLIFEEPNMDGTSTGLPLEESEYYPSVFDLSMAESNFYNYAINDSLEKCYPNSSDNSNYSRKLKNPVFSVTDWAEKGVFCMTASLTGEYSKKTGLKSHYDLWSDFNRSMLMQLADSLPNGILFCCFGDLGADLMSPLEGVNWDQDHMFRRFAEPVNFPLDSLNTFINQSVFIRINNILTNSLNTGSIDWVTWI